ncbi:inhibitor of growth proteins N-terminal histone-binding-domain-containing protein [Paraphysoderma sedebokerense]|nr:inhibitor of growth proteins N-terminal histone-binding-domain-containing protein [Paraphysoderma sedebokerense]
MVAMGDLSSYLEDYLSSLDNLPAELEHYFTELRQKDVEFQDVRSAIRQKEITYFKIRKGTAPEEKEKELVESIKTDYAKVQELSDEKIRIADRSLALLDRHIKRMDEDVMRIRDDWADFTPETQEMNNVDIDTTLARLSRYESPLPSLTARRPNAPNVINISATPTPHHRMPHLPQSAPIPNISSRQPLMGATPSQLGAGPPLASLTGSSLTPLGTSMGPRKRRTSSLSANAQRRKRMRSQTPDESSPPPGGLKQHIGMKKERNHGRDDDDNQDNALYCLCRQVSYGDMVACDAEDCPYEWFHYECVGLSVQPEGQWFCPECTKRRRKNIR